MSSGTTQSTAQVAEVDSLKARLSTAKDNQASNTEAINQLKTRHSNQYKILWNLRDEVDRKNQEAQLAHSLNKLREYRYKIDEINNMRVQRASTMREWTVFGRQIQEVHEELRVLDEEISRLERILDEQRAFLGGEEEFWPPFHCLLSGKGGSDKNEAWNVIRSRADQGFYSVGRVAKGEGLNWG